MVGASENHKVHYVPRTVTKPPEELQRKNVPFIKRCKISLNTLDVSDPRPTTCALIEFMDRFRTVLLQDVAQLINTDRTHILFDNEVFKTELLLNYKETLGNFCSTSVNTASQSLKDVITELSSQITNLKYDDNGHQNNSIDFLCSNFCQINDNAVTVKNDVARNTTVSDMIFQVSIKV